uniref:Acetyl-coenzyme A carboxylase carboxyl transferase subunit beta, chloroplastic n=1 Tax=Watanabea reniformis TaxID=191674 RepID=A0A097KK46_9CHLO|nr:beta subunit of acetyl-CoA carboxylase carboxytransferase [Watanabea reniformis]AIT93547.1 beta subunit of acetyl-CoA carboxylase carboxytransferase [Watanabea reniformis]
MSILAWIEDKKRLKLLNAPKYVDSASDSSKGLWTRCDNCGVILYIKHLKENQRVCFGCSYHLQMNSQERVETLLDKDTWRPFDETLSPCDPLEFQDQKEYTDRLEDAQERTGLQDAIQTGSGMVDGIPVALGVMDFDFMGGSMGSVVGEKITRLIEYATQEGLTLILVCASGGARMQEGVFSLMQMAKISSALQVYQSCANLLYLTILTSPTTGGVTASFAMLGDIIFAEPKALIGFAGRRVIEQTLCEELPEDFQTSEYMLHHGLLDLIVPRRFLRQALSETIRLYKDAPFKKTGNIPFGIQNPISFITEEKVRRRWTDLKDRDDTQISSNLLLSGFKKSETIVEGNNNLHPRFDGAREQADLDVGLSLSSTGENKSRLSEIEGFTKSETSPSPAVGRREGLDNSKTQVDGDTSSGIGLDFTHSGEKSSKGGELGSLQSFEASSNNQEGKKLQPGSDVIANKDSSHYRDILTSFQTMFTLFSKEMAVRYLPSPPPLVFDSGEANTFGDPKDAKIHTALELQYNSIGSSNLNQQNSLESLDSSREAGFVNAESFNSTEPSTTSPSPSQPYPPVNVKTSGLYKDKESLGISVEDQRSFQKKGGKEDKLDFSFSSLSDENQNKILANQQPEQESLLKMFRHLSETQIQTQQVSRHEVLTRRGRKEDLDKVKAQSTDFQNSPSFELQETQKEEKGDIEFLNEAIELAAHESVEWRAFYIHQKVSKTSGFLEDFAQYDGDKEGRQILENTLFYKAICKEVEAENTF